MPRTRARGSSGIPRIPVTRPLPRPDDGGVTLEYPLVGARPAAFPVGAGQLGLHHVDVALVVRRDLVPRRMVLRALSHVERAQDFERPAIEYVDDRRAPDVQKPLVRGKGGAARLEIVL